MRHQNFDLHNGRILNLRRDSFLELEWNGILLFDFFDGFG
jgi:hypothetical protein